MTWEKLTSLADLEKLKEDSYKGDVLIFKHSTRCNVSADAWEIVRPLQTDKIRVKPYFLDLLTYREISDAIEEMFQVRHQSPQILIIRKGNCIYHESHWRITLEKIAKAIQ
jgi:bacillithiol system protein YtxJ